MADKQRQYDLANPVLALWAFFTDIAMRERELKHYSPWSLLATDQVWQLVQIMPADSTTRAFATELLCKSLQLLAGFWLPSLCRTNHADMQLWLAQHPERMASLQMFLVNPAVSAWLWEGVGALSVEIRMVLNGDTSKEAEMRITDSTGSGSSSRDRGGHSSKWEDSSIGRSVAISRSSSDKEVATNTSSSSRCKAGCTSSKSTASSSASVSNRRESKGAASSMKTSTTSSTSSSSTSSSSVEKEGSTYASNSNTSTTYGTISTSSSSRSSAEVVTSWRCVAGLIVQDAGLSPLSALRLVASEVTRCVLLLSRHIWFHWELQQLDRATNRRKERESGNRAEEGNEGESKDTKDGVEGEGEKQGDSSSSSSKSCGDDNEERGLEDSSNSSSSNSQGTGNRPKLGNPCYEMGPRGQRGDFSGWMNFLLPPFPYTDFVANGLKPLPAAMKERAAAAAAEAVGGGTGGATAAAAEAVGGGTGGAIAAAAATTEAVEGETGGTPAAAAEAVGGEAGGTPAAAAAAAEAVGGEPGGTPAAAAAITAAAAGGAKAAERGEESKTAAGGGATSTKLFPAACVHAFCQAARDILTEQAPTMQLPQVTSCELVAVVKHLQVLQKVPMQGPDKGEEVSQLLLLLATVARLSSMEVREVFWKEHGRDLLVVLLALLQEHWQEVEKGRRGVASSSRGSGSGGYATEGAGKKGSSSSAGGGSSTTQQQQEEEADTAPVKDQAARLTEMSSSAGRGAGVGTPQCSSSEPGQLQWPQGLAMGSWRMVAADLQMGQGDLQPVYMECGSDIPEEPDIVEFLGAVAMVLSCLLLQPCPHAQMAAQEGAQGRRAEWLWGKGNGNVGAREGGEKGGREHQKGNEGAGLAKGVEGKEVKVEQQQQQEEEEEEWEELPEGATATFGAHGMFGQDDRHGTAEVA